jgi:penicillin-binding protein 2
VEDRQLDPRGVAVALAGLEDVVAKSYGTAHHITFGPGIGEPIFDVSGVRIAAKTGTAQAPPWKRDANGDGEIAPGESVTGLEHAWVVALVGDAPRGAWQYAIAVLVENGGSGGRVAGPIANQVIRALQAQGYVKGDVSP